MGIYEARLLVVPQHAFRNPEPFSRFLDLHLDSFRHLPSALTGHKPDAGYDAIIARNVLWALLHYEQAFHECRRILKPVG